jgi:hypothetical protein
MSPARWSPGLVRGEFCWPGKRLQGAVPARVLSQRGGAGGLAMVKAIGLVLFLVAVTGCSSGAPRAYEVTPCSTEPGSYECQIEMYKKLP